MSPNFSVSLVFGNRKILGNQNIMLELSPYFYIFWGNDRNVLNLVLHMQLYNINVIHSKKIVLLQLDKHSLEEAQTLTQ